MIHRTRMPSLEQTYELFDDPRYLESRGPDHEAYSAMANRLQNFHISPETWPMPEPFQLGRPLAPRLPVGAGGVNRPQDVADLSDGLLSLGGLGLSGWLPRTHVPTSKLNAAIAGFQRLNNLTPDGRVNPRRTDRQGAQRLFADSSSGFGHGRCADVRSGGAEPGISATAWPPDHCARHGR